MMYHAKSFADNGFQTTLVGYAGQSTIVPSCARQEVADQARSEADRRLGLAPSGSSLLPSLLSLPNFHTIPLTAPPRFLTRAPRSLFLLTAPLKVLMQVGGILRVLLWELQDPPEFVLVQVSKPNS